MSRKPILTLSGRLTRAAFLTLAFVVWPTEPLDAQETYQACYVPQVGVVYLTNLPGLPTACVAAGHIPITLGGGVGGGVTDHGTLTGLGDDDLRHAECGTLHERSCSRPTDRQVGGGINVVDVVDVIFQDVSLL